MSVLRLANLQLEVVAEIGAIIGIGARTRTSSSSRGTHLIALVEILKAGTLTKTMVVTMAMLMTMNTASRRIRTSQRKTSRRSCRTRFTMILITQAMVPVAIRRRMFTMDKIITTISRIKSRTTCKITMKWVLRMKRSERMTLVFTSRSAITPRAHLTRKSLTSTLVTTAKFSGSTQVERRK